MRGLENFLSKVLAHPVLGQELYLHTFLENNDLSQAKNIATSCKKNEESGVLDWLQTKKNVLAASESKMVKSQTMTETEERLAPIFEHMTNAVKSTPKAVDSCLTISKEYKNLMSLREKHGNSCSSLYQIDVDHSYEHVSSLQQV